MKVSSFQRYPSQAGISRPASLLTGAKGGDLTNYGISVCIMCET